MMKEKDVQKRILKAALKEFSMFGLLGARMERIAKLAKVNKAMIFYYFSSKENLYKIVIQEVFDRISPVIFRIVLSEPEPEEFLEQITTFYVDIYTRNPDFLKLVAMELLQNPKNITTVFSEFFEKMGPDNGPKRLFGLIEKWQKEGLITEKDPFQFMLNVISLSLLSFIGKPFLEALSYIAKGEPYRDDAFRENRIESVRRLLKKGLLA